MRRLFLLLSATLLIFTLASGVALSRVIHVTLTFENGQLVRTPPGPYSKSAGDSFEVTNNTDFTVWVQLYNEDDDMQGNMHVPAGETDALPLQCNERWVCYEYPARAGSGTTDFVCDQMIPIDEDWPNHKMHYPQRPDPNGWDVNCTGNVELPNATMLADDFRCSQTGYIDDIHFWGSWKDDFAGQVVMFHVAIHENIPVGPGGYSIPGDELWFTEIDESEYAVTQVDPPGDQGWYDPMTWDILPHNHQFYYRYDILLPPGTGYWQTEGTIYWLRIVAFVADPAGTAWGWKTSMDPQFMDDAVFDSYVNPGGWQELYEPVIPPDPISNFAELILDPGGQLEYGWGEDAYGDGWYFYDNTEWWNIWFFDHPFDPTRMKDFIFENAFVEPNPNYPGPGWIEVAFNWSTPDWPPGQPPPIPPLDPQDEDIFIGRETVFVGEITEQTPIDGFFQIFDYNPEWVSIDIRGYNIWFQGTLTHVCRPQDPEPQSLDLAFVITGEVDVPAYDLWETPENNNTFVDFGCPAVPPVPADFFGPGSDPFDGRIDFRGDPLETSPPDVLGPTDTIIKRNRAANLPDCPSTDGPIETEIVALSLVSVQPITVTYYGGMDPEEWDVKMCLSESAPHPIGVTTFNRDCQEGGTFMATIPVVPMFVFTRIPDGMQVFYDFGSGGPTVTYDIPEAHWQFIDSFFDVYMASGDELVSNCDDVPDIAIGRSGVDLIPGLQAIPCDNCNDPATDHLIPITPMIEPSQCAEQDIWPPHDVLEPIPTISEWGILILALLLLLAGTLAVIRKRKEVIARTK